MSETASLNEKKVYFEAPNERGESSGGALEGPLQNNNDSAGNDEGDAPVAKNSKPPSINAAATSPNEEEREQSATAVKGKQSDETIENLVALFRDFLEAAPNQASSNHITHNTHTQRNTTAGRKKFFGLTKGSQPETGSNNRYDYEQKYPRDQHGKELDENARVWLTYLDEAEAFDRERVEGWKETVDVLLVFAGLFSGVITTFVSQASQSLQQANTQVSASLLFEMAQILRAQFRGTPMSDIPNLTSISTSSFQPSTNAILVNGLWFTSLAITLSTALFAVLAKQWLHYYLSSITGTAHEKVRARQLRFKGFELWNVGAIVDLLPILLHLAVGIFLMGIIILLFPLDVRIALTIVIITGITYSLYFISVILPIRYPECPYTTSLTIYVGVLVFYLRTILRWISRTSGKGFQAVWRRINFEARYTIRRLLHYTQGLFRHAFIFILKLIGFMRGGFQKFQDTIFTEEFTKFTNWREDNIKKAVKNVALLDFEALNWLYATSPNRSVHRIIARGVAVHPLIIQRFDRSIITSLWRSFNETDVMDLRYGLCLDLLVFLHNHAYWYLLQSIPDVEESQLEEAEYRSYSRIAENVLGYDYDQIMQDVINNNLKLPLAMWCLFFEKVPWNIMAAHILIRGQRGLFEWKSDPNTRESICNTTGIVSFDDEELGWWKLEYIFRHFFGNTKPDYSLDSTFKTRYLLLVSVYRNLTSDQPLIVDTDQRQKSLFHLFDNFWGRLRSEPHISSEQYLSFFRDICCVDAFWSESMTNRTRYKAVACLNRIWGFVDADVAAHFQFTECLDLTPIYQWYSRDLDASFLMFTTPIFTLLLTPRNRTHLYTILSNEPNAVLHFTKCLQNLRNCPRFHMIRGYMFSSLMNLFKSANPRGSLFTVLYDSSVIMQVWKLLVIYELDVKKFLLLLKSKLDLEKLDRLYAAMNEQVARSDEDPDDDASELGYESDTDTVMNLDALQASAHEFGRIIGASRSRLESTPGRSSPGRAEDKDHDTEELAQVPDTTNERRGFHFIVDRIKKMFESVWPKTSVK